MADYQAIGGVSITLRTLLLDRVPAEFTDTFTVSLAPPGVTGVSGLRLNLYLYQVSENGSLKNQEIPGQGHPGAYGHPPLALDLHYLLTAYGGDEASNDSEVNAQYLLASAMRVLHDVPIVTGELRVTRDPPGPIGDPILDVSLRDEYEHLKIVFDPLGLDDFSKLWTALPNANFRRSVAYQVSVVQIESRRPRHVARLVGEPPEAGPRVRALAVHGPRITGLRVVREGSDEELSHAFARIGDALVLLGQGFLGGDRVVIGTTEVEPTEVQGQRIQVTVPVLPPGPETLRVVRDVEIGGTPRLGLSSNEAVFMLVPSITSVALDGGTVTITGTALVHPRAAGLTLIGDRAIRSAEYTAAAATSIAFALPEGLVPDTYSVRVRANGAEAPEIGEVTV